MLPHLLLQGGATFFKEYFINSPERFVMRRIIKKFISPITYFINDSRSVGVILIICTIASILLSNLGTGDWYRGLWYHAIHYPAGIHLPENPLDWINSFLMGIFFVMAGTEIKRELVEGELSSFKKAILPFGAALGGMLLPALIFTALNVGTGSLRGWGIPTATDIAFALGVASLLGKKFPIGLKIFLMALAIIDDLGAIVVIALFYGGKIHVFFLIAAAVVYAILIALTYYKVRFGFLQVLLALALWYMVFNSGVEGSISGVLFAFSVPTNKLVSVERAIHNFVSFLILPFFALANTAIFIPDHFVSALGTNIAMGVIFGLVIGKPLGIYMISRMLVASGIAQLPTNVSWKQVYGMGMLAGIGFTMAIFTTMLAYNDDVSRDISKIAILSAVTLSVVISLAYFHFSHIAVVKRFRKEPLPSHLAVALGITK